MPAPGAPAPRAARCSAISSRTRPSRRRFSRFALEREVYSGPRVGDSFKGVAMHLKAMTLSSAGLLLAAVAVLTPVTAQSRKLTGPDLIVREDLLRQQWVVRD